MCESTWPDVVIGKLISHPDDEPTKLRAWDLLKQKVLSDEQIRLVLSHAFNLIEQKSNDDLWVVFERRTAPEFVYIRPLRYEVLRDGVVIDDGAIDAPGNGVEVHRESSGRGPFAWSFTNFVSERGEFRVYYNVTHAPTLEWLEGFESYLQFPPPQPGKASKLNRTSRACGLRNRVRCMIYRIRCLRLRKSCESL